MNNILINHYALEATSKLTGIYLSVLCISLTGLLLTKGLKPFKRGRVNGLALALALFLIAIPLICIHGSSGSLFKISAPKSDYQPEFVVQCRSALETLYDQPIGAPPSTPPILYKEKIHIPALVIPVVWIIVFLVLAIRRCINYLYLLSVRKKLKTPPLRWLQMLKELYPGLKTGAVKIGITSSLKIPATFGIFRHTICLPPEAVNLSEQELTAIFIHEMVHIKNRDFLVQQLGFWVCTALWPIPFCKKLISRLLREQELRCDKKVLERGIRKTDYAQLLLNLSRTEPDLSPLGACTAGISHSTDLEIRIVSVLAELRPSNLTSIRGITRNHRWLRYSAALAIFIFGMFCMTQMPVSWNKSAGYIYQQMFAYLDQPGINSLSELPDTVRQQFADFPVYWPMEGSRFKSAMYQTYIPDPVTNRITYGPTRRIIRYGHAAAVCAADGIISSIYNNPQDNSCIVSISHKNGFTSVYTYLEEIPESRIGEFIKQGEAIGRPRKAFTAYQYYYHFAIHDGVQFIDPIHFIGDGVTRLIQEPSVE